jgi:actin-related protein
MSSYIVTSCANNQLRHLLIDSRPRRMAVALPTTLPLPLLSTVLDTLFNTFQPPTVSLMSAPMLATAAAGLRAALVVDIGWAETVVTAIFEYREVLCCRSTRACKLLGQEMQKVLIKAVEPSSLPRDEMKATTEANSNEHKTSTGIVSFEECEDVTERMAWCKPTEKFEDANATKGLASVQEEDEIEAGIEGLNISGSKSELVSIQLTSTKKPTTIQLPFSSLAEPCEVAFFGDGNEDIKWDDEELPMHQLIYRSLMKLPVDVRSICMARIIFTGGGSNIPGLKIRLLEEIHSLIRRKGWDPVEGNAVNRLLNNTKLARKRSKQASNGPIEVTYTGPPEDKVDERQNAAAFKDQESDPIEEQLRREAKRGTIPTIQGTLRAIDSMGAWSGASLLSQLKIPAVAVIEREQWLQHGISGASRPGEAIVTSTRQSMGPAGLRPGAGERSTWTLGPWA